MKRWMIDIKIITYKDMVERLLEDQLSLQGGTNAIYYLRDGEDNYHKVSEVDLYSGKTKCEDGYYDYNEFIIEDEGTDDRLFEK